MVSAMRYSIVQCTINKTFTDYVLIRKDTKKIIHPSPALARYIEDNQGICSMKQIARNLDLEDAAWQLFGIYETAPFYEEVLRRMPKATAKQSDIDRTLKWVKESDQLIRDYPASTHLNRTSRTGIYYCKRSLFLSMLASSTFDQEELSERQDVSDDDADAFCLKLNEAVWKSVSNFTRREQVADKLEKGKAMPKIPPMTKAQKERVKLRLAVVQQAKTKPVDDICKANNISRITFYSWYGRYVLEGEDGLIDRNYRSTKKAL